MRQVVPEVIQLRNSLGLEVAGHGGKGGAF